MAYEIHAIGTATTSIAQLEANIGKLPSDALRPRVCVAHTLYGRHTVQPMLTWWLGPGSVENISERVGFMIKQLSFPVVRVKIEALQSLAPAGHSLPAHVTSQYWEFHGKIRGADTYEQWQRAARLCAPFGCHLFWNDAKEGPRVPIIALRRYGCTKEAANGAMAELVCAIEDAGFALDERHAEWGLQDTCPALDGGWMFPAGGNPAHFLREVPAV